MDHEELHQEIRLSETVIWDITREFPEEAQRLGMMPLRQENIINP